MARSVNCIIFQLLQSFCRILPFLIWLTHIPIPFYTIRYLLSSVPLTTPSRSHPSSLPAQGPMGPAVNHQVDLLCFFGQPDPLVISTSTISLIPPAWPALIPRYVRFRASLRWTRPRRRRSETDYLCCLVPASIDGHTLDLRGK